MLGSSLRDLPKLRNCIRKRESSWDRTGGNDDRVYIKPGEKKLITDITGIGCITHIWMTAQCEEQYFLRKILLRAWWDQEESPSIEVPLGDFFGMGHAKTKNYVSLPLSMGPQNGKAFNCFFPMPFFKEAKIEIDNGCSQNELILYYFVDYEIYSTQEELGEVGLFHACWHRDNPCQGIKHSPETWHKPGFTGYNLDGKNNYIILDAAGRGQYVGCNLNIENLGKPLEWNYYGEGDDMIFIDGEKWPPSLHGTGTEDYFNLAWSPNQEYYAPNHGILLKGGNNWSGKITYYRFHIEDPICFQKSIRVTIEHGHANDRSDDYSSTAYWYQTEPHQPFSPMLSVVQRLPMEIEEL
ncbi:glycoside hydrolase family 172 protein [Atribacter laminatus]|uniref:DUF2961 domain-containing protein n=1 Tax=Atribacter laminatus TaxID=2847778 RepID=A0A7T1ALM5_ATRLM|nr:glycoside hydrolase family 172 protein [Atribacter laminatus]QPM68144.1 hypothetical protein RT761_01358 [Atribacter laminatus]